MLVWGAIISEAEAIDISALEGPVWTRRQAAPKRWLIGAGFLSWLLHFQEFTVWLVNCLKWTKVGLFLLLHHRTWKVSQILLPNPNVQGEQRADGSPSGQAWGRVLCILSACLSPLVVPSPASGRTLSHMLLWAFSVMLDSRERVRFLSTLWVSDGMFVFTSGRKQEEYFVDNRCDWGTVDDTFTSVSWVSPGSILLSMNR